MPSPGLDGMSLAGSWCISGEVTLPNCSPLYEGHVGLVKLEISSGISQKLHLESKLQLPCYGIVLRFVFQFLSARLYVTYR